MRIGFGYDIHPLTANRPLIIGGVTIPFNKGLSGHSDADVMSHAIADALLGAAGLGDIGQHFPDTDDKYKNYDSMKILQEVERKVYFEKFKIVKHSSGALHSSSLGIRSDPDPDAGSLGDQDIQSLQICTATSQRHSPVNNIC